MKILIVSDSHGRIGNLLEAVDRELPDHVFHLGDLIRDAEELSDVYPDLPVHGVVGNCDGWAQGPEELEVELDGVKFLLAHGHCYHAKLGPGALLRAGRDRGMDVVCYGHTHEPLCQLQPGGLWLVNPGTVGGIHNKATYAAATLEDGAVSVQIKEL